MPRPTFMEVCTQSGLELDRDGTRRVEKRFETIFKKSPRMITLIVAAVAILLTTGCVIGSALAAFVGFLGGNTVVVGVVAGTLTPACVLGVWFLLLPRILRRGMRQALRDCGYDVCVSCGYNLVETDSAARCPECGRVERSPLGAADITTAHPGSGPGAGPA